MIGLPIDAACSSAMAGVAQSLRTIADERGRLVCQAIHLGEGRLLTAAHCVVWRRPRALSESHRMPDAVVVEDSVRSGPAAKLGEALSGDLFLVRAGKPPCAVTLERSSPTELIATVGCHDLAPGESGSPLVGCRQGNETAEARVVGVLSGQRIDGARQRILFAPAPASSVPTTAWLSIVLVLALAARL